jgi:hypothetical protein
MTGTDLTPVVECVVTTRRGRYLASTRLRCRLAKAGIGAYNQAAKWSEWRISGARRVCVDAMIREEEDLETATVDAATWADTETKLLPCLLPTSSQNEYTLQADATRLFDCTLPFQTTQAYSFRRKG